MSAPTITTAPGELGDGYATAAPVYALHGWAPLVLPSRRKEPPPVGFTGRDGVDPTLEQLEAWRQQQPHGGVALRVPAGVVGIDVDQYAHKHGADRLAELEAELGALPPTFTSSARPSPSGIRWYRVPAGVELLGDPLDDVELVQRHHRYAVAPPSVHPTTGDRYRWHGPDGLELALPPRPEQLPELPAAYVERWRSGATRAVERPPQPPTPAPPDAEPSRAVCEALSDVEWQGGRHDAMTELTMRLARLEHEGHAGASAALELDGPAFAAFAAALNGERDAAAEWRRAVDGARVLAARTEPPMRKLDASSYLQGVGAMPVLEQQPRTSWEPVDLRAVLGGARPPAPSMWRHRGGFHLLYAGRTHWAQGDSESCKSWFTQAGGMEVIAAGADVLTIDYEDDAAGVVDRYLALGATHDQLVRHLVYVRPDEPLADRHGNLTPAGERCAQLVHERPWRLVIVDGVTEAMTTEGLDINDNGDAARFTHRVLRPFADAGAAVVAIDHQTKSTEGGRRFAIGAQHKLSGLSGAAYTFTTLSPFARAEGTEPVVGRVKVTVSKDRPGYVRARAVDRQQVGVMELTAYPDGGVSIELVNPADSARGGTADMELVGRILEHLTLYTNGVSTRQLIDAVGGKHEHVRDAVAYAAGKDWLKVEPGARGAHLHVLTDTGRREMKR